MRFRVVPALLILVASVFSLLLVACPGPTQTANVTVACDAAGCGRTGQLYMWLDDCSGNVVVTSKTPGVTLSLQTPLTVQLKANGGTDVTGDCVHGFLDVNTNGTLDAGDVMAAVGPIKVDATERASFTLDTVTSSPGLGTLYLDVSCTGAGCGKSGLLYGQVVSSSAASPTIVASQAVHGVTLVAGSSHRVSLSNLTPGRIYGRAFLSVNTSAIPAAGDAVMTSNRAIAITMTSNATPLAVPITLTTSL